MEITKEDLDALRQRDERWRHIDLSLKIDAELKTSLLINLVIEAATRKAEAAKDALVTVNPSDTDAVIALQAEAKCARLIGDTLRNVSASAEIAYAEIRGEQPENTPMNGEKV